MEQIQSNNQNLVFKYINPLVLNFKPIIKLNVGDPDPPPPPPPDDSPEPEIRGIPDRETTPPPPPYEDD